MALKNMGTQPGTDREERLASGPAVGRVKVGPDPDDGTITVVLDSFDEGRQFFAGVRWVSNDALAEVGDVCLVFHEVLETSSLDGEADPWAIVWRMP